MVYGMASRGQQDSCHISYVAVRDGALMLLGWAGMFRSSELVGVEWEHVKFSGSGVMIHIPRSKTDQAADKAAGGERGVCVCGKEDRVM